MQRHASCPDHMDPRLLSRRNIAFMSHARTISLLVPRGRPCGRLVEAARRAKQGGSRAARPTPAPSGLLPPRALLVDYISNRRCATHLPRRRCRRPSQPHQSNPGAPPPTPPSPAPARTPVQPDTRRRDAGCLSRSTTRRNGSDARCEEVEVRGPAAHGGGGAADGGDGGGGGGGGGTRRSAGGGGGASQPGERSRASAFGGVCVCCRRVSRLASVVSLRIAKWSM